MPKLGAKLAIHAGVVIAPPGAELLECDILIDGEHIDAVGLDLHIPKNAKVIDARKQICVPGFIDMHVHGAGGHDLMEATPEAFRAVSTTLARYGTTSFFPTTVTASVPKTEKALAAIGKWIDKAPRGVSQPLGIHMEGPFISHKRLGVHPPQHVLPPTAKQFKQFVSAAGEHLRVMTVAPEVPGAEDVIAAAAKSGVRIAMGHTDATYDQAIRAANLGVRHAVHMFNAMRPFGHRDPGVIGAVLLDERVSAELIADGVHVDPAAIRVLMKAKGPEDIVLITDGLSPVGMPEKIRYRLGEFDVEVRGGAVRNLDGVLAGSILTLDQAIRNMMEFTALPLRSLVRMTSYNQAKLMGLAGKGVIAKGADADLVLLNRDLSVAKVFVRGQLVHG